LINLEYIFNLLTMDGQSYSSANSEFMNSKNSNSENEKKWKLVGFIGRISSYMIIIIIAAVNSIFATAMVSGEPKCIDDKIFYYTSDINDYFQRNKSHAYYLIIFSSLLLDLNLLSSTVYWYKSGKNWKPFITVIFICLTKAIVNSLFNFKYPAGMIYDYPGFPSLSVSYRKSSTLFFSLNAALTCILLVMSYEGKWKANYWFGLVTLIIYSFTALVMRFHYVIDIFGGIVCAHYFYILSEWPAHLFESIFSIKQINEDIS
jgi:hypothetical protein